MTIKKHITVTLLTIITTITTWASEPCDSVATDSVKGRADYPERLITEFPVIYADTAYTTPQYHVVVRAVWMAKRKHSCKVTSPDQLPEPPDATMIRFVPCQEKATFHTDAMVIQRK